MSSGSSRSTEPDVRFVGDRRRAARHRRDDADRVARLHRRLLLLQVPDVLVVDVDVDEAAQLALLVVQVRLQPGVLRRQVGEQLADGRAVGVDGVLLIGVRPQRCGNQNFRRHVKLALFETGSIVLADTTTVMSLGARRPRPTRSRTRTSATRDRDRTATAAPDDRDASDRTRAARRRARSRAAPPAGSRTAAPETGAAALLRSCSAARTTSRSRGRRVPTSAPQHSCGYVSSPCRRIARVDRRAINDQRVAQSSAVQNVSVRYFSAPSGKTVTMTPRSSRRATSSDRGERRAGRDADQQPFLAREPPHHLVRALGARRADPRRRASDRRCRARSPTPCASALRGRGTASPAETRSA